MPPTDLRSVSKAEKKSMKRLIKIIRTRETLNKMRNVVRNAKNMQDKVNTQKQRDEYQRIIDGFRKKMTKLQQSKVGKASATLETKEAKNAAKEIIKVYKERHPFFNVSQNASTPLNPFAWTPLSWPSSRASSRASSAHSSPKAAPSYPANWNAFTKTFTPVSSAKTSPKPSAKTSPKPSAKTSPKLPTRNMIPNIFSATPNQLKRAVEGLHVKQAAMNFTAPPAGMGFQYPPPPTMFPPPPASWMSGAAGSSAAHAITGNRRPPPPMGRAGSSAAHAAQMGNMMIFHSSPKAKKAQARGKPNQLYMNAAEFLKNLNARPRPRQRRPSTNSSNSEFGEKVYPF